MSKMKRNLEETLIFFKPDAIKLNLVNTIYKEFILKNKYVAYLRLLLIK